VPFFVPRSELGGRVDALTFGVVLDDSFVIEARRTGDTHPRFARTPFHGSFHVTMTSQKRLWLPETSGTSFVLSNPFREGPSRASY
jgi:hypothetical protein